MEIYFLHFKYFDKMLLLLSFYRSQRITEKFLRNPKKQANDDIAERVFDFEGDSLFLKSHYKDNSVTFSTREYRNLGRKIKNKVAFDSKLVSGYQVLTE